MSRRNRKDVDDLLADLDNLGTEAPTKPARKSADKGTATPTPATADASAKKAPEDAQTLLDDLDSLMQSRANSSSRASQRKKDESTSATTAAATASAPPTASSEKATAAPTISEPTGSTDTAAVVSSDEKAAAAGSSGGWSGWGSSLFSQATKLADQARQEFEKRAPTQAEQARELGSKGWDLAKGVRGFVKEAGLEKWGRYRSLEAFARITY